MPVDASIQTVLQEHALVAVARWDHAAVHEVELNKLSVGQVQVHCHQLAAATLCTDMEMHESIRGVIQRTLPDHNTLTYTSWVQFDL